jgi:hypothetical protein
MRANTLFLSANTDKSREAIMSPPSAQNLIL